MKLRGTVIAALAVSLSVAGCGGRVSNDAARAERASAPTTAPEVVGGLSTAAPPAPVAIEPDGSAAAASPATEVAAAPVDAAVVAPASEPSSAAPSEGFAVAATVVPGCVTAGQSFAVRLRSAAHARFSMVIAYADDRPHGAMGFGDADASGSYVWRLTVPVDAPTGGATAFVGAQPASDPQTNGTAEAPFVVARPGGCP